MAAVPSGALADRLHNRALQALATALVRSEMCERLTSMGRTDEVAFHLADMREALEQTSDELRAIMEELKRFPAMTHPAPRARVGRKTRAGH